MRKVIYHRKKCIACGYCCEISPHFWQINHADGKCDLLGGTGKNDIYRMAIFDSDLSMIQECVDACPADCIDIEL